MHESSKKEAKLIGIAMVAGLILGLIFHYADISAVLPFFNFVGDIFLRLLRMVIIPLVFSSIFMAMINLGTPESLGSMGLKALGYYFVTTAVAVFIGLIFVNLINPGAGADLATAGLDQLPGHVASKVAENKSLLQIIMGEFLNAIPKNPVAALANGKILQVIVFSIIFGIVALYFPKSSVGVVTGMESLEKMSLHLTHGVMKIAPYGIFAIMTNIMAKSGFSVMVTLGKYMLTVVLGLAVHAVFLMTIGCIRAKKSPLFIIKGLASPLLTAFTTSSSAATLPITMTSVEENLGVKKETAKFVLPLGATVNMDGTALYESVAAIFIAQAYSVDLSFGQQMVIFMTASLAAVGAAAIPGAGLVTLGIVLTAVGLPLEGIGIILAVDRILDMFRTTLNVFGDCVGTVVVDSLMEKDSFKDVDDAEEDPAY